MKEKIGMEKLIELLNEYERERVNHSMIDFIPYGEKSLNDLSVAQVISKKYGFIKWLVENDKIDIDKLKFQSDFMFPLWKDFDQLGSEDIEEYSEYESLLMLLAIQDEPINFLISILK